MSLKSKVKSFIFTLLYLIGKINNGESVEASSPLYGNLKLRFEEVILSDSSNLEDKYGLYWIKDFNVDSENSLIILFSEYIAKFDEKGNLKMSYKIKLGQGPGECNNYPSLFFIDSSDNLYLYDGYKIILLKKNFEFEKNIKLVFLPNSRLIIDKEGFLYALKFKPSSEVALAKIDKDGKTVKELASFQYSEVKKLGGISFFSYHHYSPNVYYSLCHDDIVIGYNLKYQLFKYKSDGNLNVVINVNKEPQKISSAEKEWIENNIFKKIKTNVKLKIEFPPYRPFFKEILCDEKGRIWVIRTKSVLEKDKKEKADIFSKDGRYLFEVELPYFPRIIKNGCIWVIDRDEEDRTLIKKLTIKNYSSLRY